MVDDVLREEIARSTAERLLAEADKWGATGGPWEAGSE